MRSPSVSVMAASFAASAALACAAGAAWPARGGTRTRPRRTGGRAPPSARARSPLSFHLAATSTGSAQPSVRSKERRPCSVLSGATPALAIRVVSACAAMLASVSHRPHATETAGSPRPRRWAASESRNAFAAA